MTTPLIIKGQPRYGRFESPPSAINANDYSLQSAFDQPITGLRAKLKRKFGFKSFQFIGINNQDVVIGLAIVDLGWAGNGFFYCYDRRTNAVVEISELQPLARQTQVDHPAANAHCRFQKGDFQIDILRSALSRKVVVSKGQQCLLEAQIETAMVEPLALCNPTGATGWTYTQKQTAETVRGSFLQNGQRVEISPEAGFLAASDDSCGYLSYRTSWRWLSVSATLATGQRVGVNFAMGVNTGFGTENALWIDGKIFEIAPVMFEQLEEGKWRVYSADGSVDLSVQTGWCRQETINLGLVASHFNQWVSHVTGTIRHAEQHVVFNGEIGLLEKHFAKW
jgi:hypothetical protein